MVKAEFEELGTELKRRIDYTARDAIVVGELAQGIALYPRLPNGFRAAFTTRLRRETEGSWTSYDLSLRRASMGSLARTNRELLQGALGREVVSPRQVHGVRVSGLADYHRSSRDAPCDGLVLHRNIDQGLAAVLLFADCVPIVLCGEVDFAVVHGGWRGLLRGITQAAAAAMTSAPGLAVIGPSIGPCCFAVGPEVARGFEKRFGSGVVISEPSGLRVDLWQAAEKALGELGLGPERIVNPRLCTCCNPDFFFSYRREGSKAGRQACVAWIS
ncbi:MAG: polyphenol oxidase family protein [Thermoleophilia bacterium]|nr:polyphenol oxidase family protein [Thermoleophilia bacterium]